MKRVFKTLGGNGGGAPALFAWQSSSATFLASANAGSSSVALTDRKGVLVATIPVAGECLDLKWSPDGGCLALVQSKSLSLILWEVTDMSKPATQIETGMKNMESLAWSCDSETIAVSTSKGNIFLYGRRNGKKTPVIGKHTKGIVAIQWSSKHELACASWDKSFTLSNRDGDTTHQVALKGEPSLMQWSDVTQTDGITHTVLSIVIGGKTLYLFDPTRPQNPMEITFNPRYGTIAKYQWFKNTQILIGFVSGYLTAISTTQGDLGKELFQSKSYKDSLGDVVVSRMLNSVATCGDSVIKIHDISNLQDVSSLITLENERGALTKLQFSDDGQFLTVSTKDGGLYTYLSRLPMLGCVWSDRVGYLTGLTEVAVTSFATVKETTVKCDVGNEPMFIAMGPKHLAVGVGSKVRYHVVSPPAKRVIDGIGFEYNAVGSTESLSTSANGLSASGAGKQPALQISPVVWEKDYTMQIKQLVMNDHYAAVLLESGELHLHPLDDEFFNPKNSNKAPLTLVFPEDQQSNDTSIVISCVAMTHEFMVYGTTTGTIVHYDISEIVMVNEYKHAVGIRAVYPRPGLGTKLVFIDEKNSAFVMSPIVEAVVEVPSLPPTTRGILWETASPSGRYVFVSWDDTAAVTYLFSPQTIKGPQCRGVHANATRLPYGLRPVLFHRGSLVCQTPTGKIEQVAMATHEELGVEAFLRKYPNDTDQGRALRLMYMAGKTEGIWRLYPSVTSRRAWTTLAVAALHSMDIATAKRVYRQMLCDAGMVMNLTRIESVEDRIELQGHTAVIFGDFALAQQCFLTSSNPKEALYLRRDLLDWDQALALATRMALDEVSVISREYAMQLEMDGNVVEALAMYERALATPVRSDMDDEELAEHHRLSRSGLIRTVFRTGDLARGMSLVNDVTERSLLLECASILESLKQLSEAALILERGGMYERAAEFWIRLKSWSKLGKIIDKLNSTKIFLQYARAKEAEKQYMDAASAFERAKDYDNVARVLLEHMGDHEGAALLVRKTRSRESAKMMIKAFLEKRDYRTAVEFYLMAGMPNEAFELAKSQDVVEHFSELVQDEASNELLTSIAIYFESKGMYVHAGRFHLHASHYSEALKMFLRSPAGDATSIELAIETVGHAKSDALTHELIDFLMGETDGIPKDAKYIFKLYMSLGQFREAARTAIIIAREEQVLGNYRAAHDLLYDNYRQLKVTKAKVPAELDHMLMLLHSYTLVKTLVRIDDHVNGAQMLVRVSKNISKFPAHVVPILTSTVVECHRAGFKKAAFEYAAMLMRPEYRSKVDAKFKRKIEQIVRRPDKEVDAGQGDGDGNGDATGVVADAMAPCPYCTAPTIETSLECGECRNRLPYCIATGRHMVADGWGCCPACEFPAQAAALRSLLGKTGQCPMCGATVAAESVVALDAAAATAALRWRRDGVEEGGGVSGAPGAATGDAGGGGEAVRKESLSMGRPM